MELELEVLKRVLVVLERSLLLFEESLEGFDGACVSRFEFRCVLFVVLKLLEEFSPE